MESKRYKFGFQDGGFNFVYALSLLDAKRRIFEEYEYNGYKIRYDSVKLVEDEVYYDMLNTTI
tara:strand:- start:156 stop:344 length:189 start_codon:yes stop_codon:yes gene_type:complete